MLLAPVLAPPAARAAFFDHGPVVNVTEENDFVNGTDRWYSEGTQISYLQADNDVPRWTENLLRKIPSGFRKQRQPDRLRTWPEHFHLANTHTSALQFDDRPYAGWLYGGLILQRRGSGAGGFPTLESLRLELGIIGPESFADNLQTWYHDHAPQGWKHQLQDEPAIALRYGRAWLLSLPATDQRYFDFIPHVGLSAGNVDTSFRAGATLRVGWHLPDDFGSQPIQSLLIADGGWSPSEEGRRWGFYVFTGAEGSAVLYTAFLDGNAFRDSHHVDKESFVGEWRSGLALIFNRVELIYTHLFRTRDFRKQPEGQVYGSLSLRVKF
ncbi:MAG: lipid A deacylase LpxR family protein [Verrucomicrobiota bacterium]